MIRSLSTSFYHSSLVLNSSSSSTISSILSYSTITVTKEAGLRSITLNRPDKLNAFNNDMYNEVLEQLGEAAKDEETTVTTITGAGKYFSSGNDMTSFSEVAAGGRREFSTLKGERLLRFVDAFIDFPKPLVGVVNGPAIGIGCTMLGLMDVVFASSSATFHVPFTTLALTPEACSSRTFPRIMGSSVANQMLLFNRKLTAEEAAAHGFVSEVLPANLLHSELAPRLAQYASLPSSALQYSKALVRGEEERAELRQLNRMESNRLMERWLSDEVFQQAQNFLSRRKK